MLKIRFAAAAIALGAVLTAVATAQTPGQPGAAIPDGKIVVVNPDEFPEKVGELRQKYELVRTQFNDRFQKLQALYQELKQMETDIQQKGPAMTQDKVREMQSAFEDKRKRGVREEEDLKADYERALEAAVRPVREKLIQFLQGYCAQRSIILVLNWRVAAQSGVLTYWNGATDVTQDFIAEYNKANPVPGATNPGASGQARQR